MSREKAIETFQRIDHVLRFLLGEEAAWSQWQGKEELPAQFHSRSRLPNVVMQELWRLREINQRAASQLPQGSLMVVSHD
jgi:hypothetical protein